MGWNFSASTVSYDAQQKITDLMDERDGFRDDEVGNKAASGLTLVGLSASKIDDVKDKITTEIKRLNNIIEGINELATAENAFKSDSGELETAIKNYILNVKNYIRTLITRLNAFNTRLEFVKSAWNQATKNMASTVETYTNTMKVEAPPEINNTIESRTTGSISNGSSLY